MIYDSEITCELEILEEKRDFYSESFSKAISEIESLEKANRNIIATINSRRGQVRKSLFFWEVLWTRFILTR